MIRIWRNLAPNRRGEILGVVVITVALIILLSLVSYDSEDFTRLEGRTHNWIGRPGAYLAKGAFASIGWTAFLVPILLLYWGVRRFRSHKFSSTLFPLSGVLILILSLCTLLSMVQYPDRQEMFKAGGVIGSFSAQRMAIFGPVGSYLILASLVAVSVLMSTEILFMPLLAQSWQKSREHWAKQREARRQAREKKKKETIKTNLKSTPRISKKFRRKETPGEQEEEKSKKKTPVVESNEEDVFVITAVEPDTLGGNDADELFPVISAGGDKSGKKKKKSPKSKPQKAASSTRRKEDYRLPALTLFDKSRTTGESLSRDEILFNSETLERTLSEFGIDAKVVEVNHGPVITRYEIEPPPGVKINRIVGLSDNLALALRAHSVRIVAPIPGKAAVGVEIPNRKRSEVLFREIATSDTYQSSNSLLKLSLGKTISGEPFVSDLSKMPHLLIAGATGSGKSVCVNTIISSILVNATPDEVKFLMIDPKRVELTMYSDIPHMIAPVVTHPKRAAAALRWVVEEMEDRYRHLSKLAVRDIDEYNRKQKVNLTKNIENANPSLPSRLPYIVVIIDELADLMMVARGEIEGAVCRLAQMARAVGIHIVLATQRPSVNIITGVIKANFPTRIAFQVSSKVDSRTILDSNGAETLLGMGDMLFSYGGAAKPVRLQGSLITTREVEQLTEYIKAQRVVEYLEQDFKEEEEAGGINDDGLSGDDDLYQDAVELVLSSGSASTSLLQRRLKIGYGRAARLLDEMEQQGIVGPPRGSKPREVLAGQ